MSKLGLTTIFKYLALVLTLFFYSCLDQNTKKKGQFAMSGFNFDIEPPIVSLISSHGQYVNMTIVEINLETGVNLRNCDYFDAIAITESNSVPTDSAYIYSCTTAINQTLNYQLNDTTEGPRTLYVWSKDRAKGKISAASTVNFLLDTTAPTGSISAVPSFLQGGSTHTLTINTNDNFEVASTNLTIANGGTGNWGPVTYSQNFGSATDVTFPTVDSSASRLRWLIYDAAGNSKEIISNTFVIDTIAPALSLPNPSVYIAGGSSYSISYSATDLNGLSAWSLGYSKDNGATFTTIASNPANPYSWSVPTDNTTTGKFRLDATDMAGNSSSLISSTFTVDSMPPAISLTNPPTWLKGGNPYNIVFSASDSSGIASLSLEYAQDGITYNTLTTTNTSPYTWTIPTVNIPIQAKFKLTVIDNSGNQSQLISSAFGIDSTAPSVTLNNMAAIIRGGINNNVGLTSSDAASGIASAVLSYSTDNGSTYSALATTPATPSYSWATPAVDITTARLQYVVTDNVGNSTTVQNNVFEIDSTAPTSTMTSPTSVIRGGDTLSLNFTATDTNGIGSLSYEYAANGTTFSVLSATPTSPYSWTVPTSTTTASKLRLVATDSVGNQSIISSTAFNIDSTASPVANVSLNSALYS